MNDERVLTPSEARKALALLSAAGYDVNPALLNNSVGAIVWWLGKSSAKRRHTVAELLECVTDPEAA
jgi:hypothetical protein